MVLTSFSASGMILVINAPLLYTNIYSSWVLIAFKREFAFGDVLRLWEVLWTDYYSREFVLFVALAVLESHRDMILRYLVEVRDFFFFQPYASQTEDISSTV
jgi:hypothetical protein